MCVLGRGSLFIREEALKPFSQPGGLSTQLFAEGTALVQVQLLLETVFTSLLQPGPLTPARTHVPLPPPLLLLNLALRNS